MKSPVINVEDVAQEEEGVEQSLHKAAHALRPVRMLEKENTFRFYEGTTFPNNPRQGCALYLRRCEVFGWLVKDDANLTVDVLDREGDVIQDFPITRKGFNYLRRTWKLRVAPAEE